MAKKIAVTDEDILLFIKQHPNQSSTEIYEGFSKLIGFATVKRILSRLKMEGKVSVTGNAKASRYFVAQDIDFLLPIDVDQYFALEIDQREIRTGFNFDLLNNLSRLSLFTTNELIFLDELQAKFERNISNLSTLEYKKEFERLAIDLSWKSSQIEGNTYTLLETERLLKEQETAVGKKKDEATMLLNHKAALDFIIDHPNYVQPLTVSCIEDIHSLLIEDLNVPRNIRNRRVGISGTNYMPLDNEFQIKESLTDLCILINSKTNIFEKALLLILLISYIQPFADGNKRTARIMCNAILLHNRYCPISFRTVDSIDYKKAMLVFYEQNNITAFKKIFIQQFEFAVNTYF